MSVAEIDQNSSSSTASGPVATSTGSKSIEAVQRSIGAAVDVANDAIGTGREAAGKAIDSGRDAAGNLIETGRAVAGKAIDTSMEVAGKALEQGRDMAGKTIETTRDAAAKAIGATRDTFRETTRRTAEGVDANPLSVLVGGVALGVLVGALIPRSDQESKLLSPVGERLASSATGALAAAKDAGKAELENLGLSRDAARDQIGKILEGLVKALTSAGNAAVKASSGVE